jgi:hypothetical protein
MPDAWHPCDFIRLIADRARPGFRLLVPWTKREIRLGGKSPSCLEDTRLGQLNPPGIPRDIRTVPDITGPIGFLSPKWASGTPAGPAWMLNHALQFNCQSQAIPNRDYRG